MNESNVALTNLFEVKFYDTNHDQIFKESTKMVSTITYSRKSKTVTIEIVEWENATASKALNPHINYLKGYTANELFVKLSLLRRDGSVYQRMTFNNCDLVELNQKLIVGQANTSVKLKAQLEYYGVKVEHL